MDKENWKEIKWYKWKYQVSNLWNIKSLDYNNTWKEQILKSLNCSWYVSISLSENSKQKHFYIHRLVAEYFVLNIENKKEVNHKDWVKNNNRVENLEWVTHSENHLHKFRILWYKCHLQTNHPSKWKFWKDNPSSKKVNQYSLMILLGNKTFHVKPLQLQ